MLSKRDFLRSAAMTTIAIASTGGPLSAQTNPAWPRLLEAKDIAEEGFIYGLPLVMIYAVMQEFAVDKNSGQFKAPFNQILNMHHVATPADTAVITPNSDTPYSMLWLDLRAEPMVVSVPMIERDRYYAVQLIDSNTYNYGYIGTRATGTARPDGVSAASSRFTLPAALRTPSRCGASTSIRPSRTVRSSGRRSSIRTFTLPT